MTALLNNPTTKSFLHILRDKDTNTVQFRWASDSLSRILCSDVVAKLPHTESEVVTPVGTAQGPTLTTDVMAVPIYRAGQSMVHAFLEVVPQAVIGSVLIQRDEETAQPKLFYRKFPPKLPAYAVILDPMLATAGSAVLTVDILMEAGYDPENIYFMGVVAAREGFDRLAERIGLDHITVAAIDPELNSRKYIVPGLGDYGDRYFGTQE